MSANTSSARPPLSAMKKLACLSDTTAVPTRSPFAARRVDEPAGRVVRRVGEHRAGVLPAGLVLAPPPHDRRDQVASAIAASPRSSASSARSHDLRRADRRTAGTRGRWTAAAIHSSSPDARSTTRTLVNVAAMSEPWPPAFMRTAPPIEPGTPTAHSNPVKAAAAVRRATTGKRGRSPGRHRRTVDRRRRRTRRRA